ncbi:MAG: hypothetical protein ABI863_11555 [Ginsengibacter sp.]
MKRFLFVLIALPFFCVAQDKNVVSSTRVFPKSGKSLAFEKALAAHAQKYHTGNWKWRIFTIESGPDAGGYQITEGPMSWDDLDTRGDLGKAHTADWETNIAPLLLDKTGVTYAVYRIELSSVALTEFSNKIAINHVFYKPGTIEEVEDILKKLKKAWDASSQTVAVYEASSSGEPSFSVVTRYKQGLKERASGFRKPMKERYNLANGENSWDAYVQGVKNTVDHSWSELLFFHPELSSK